VIARIVDFLMVMTAIFEGVHDDIVRIFARYFTYISSLNQYIVRRVYLEKISYFKYITTGSLRFVAGSGFFHSNKKAK